MANPRALAWCFTLNNPSEDEVLLPQSWDPEDYKYLVYQLERGESGTPHLQGYISMEKRITFNVFRTWFPDARAHIEVAKGTAAQNKTYCTKTQDKIEGPWEFGVMPEQGKRSDLLAVKEKLDSGATLKEISQEHFGSFVRYHRSFREYKLLNTEPRDWPMDVRVLYGPTGSGKSRHCLREYPGAYWKSKNSGQQQFWDGYLGEDTIIIDEFYGWLAWDYLLRLLDRYPFSLDTKHGTVQCSARTIVLTSNKHPKDWYPNSKYGWDVGNPLKRRIISITELGVAEPTGELARMATDSPTDPSSQPDEPVPARTGDGRPRFRNGLLVAQDLYELIE